jgi:hypothetical protein
MLFMVAEQLPAQPVLPKFAPPLSGRVVDERDGQGAAKAVVVVYQRGEVLSEARTDDEGHFKITNLPKTPTNLYVVLARYLKKQSGAAPTVRIISLGDDQPLEIKLPAAQPLQLRITNTAGQPLGNTLVTVPKINYIEQGAKTYAQATIPWTYGGLPISDIGVSNEQGEVAFSDLPQGANIYVEVQKKGFADTVAKIKMPSPAVTLKVAKETIVEGTVMLNETEPLGVPQWKMKMQGWSAPWAEGEYFRTGNLDAQGNYRIRNVTSLDVLNEPGHSINLDMWGATNPTPEISGAYVPPNGGWDLMVKRTREGKIERYISFVKALDKGLKYQEGERVRHDMMLVPMAQVKGIIPAPILPEATVSYHDARSIYGPWQVKPAKDGSFEIPVPMGDVALTIGNRVLKITGLRAQEIRVLSAEEILAAPESAPRTPRTILR